MDIVFKNQAQYSLNSVDFHQQPMENDNDPINVTIFPVDSMMIVRRGLKNVVISVRRSLGMKPDVVFTLDVEIHILIEFEDGCDTSGASDDDIIMAFKKSCGGFLSTVMARISVIISEITSVNGQTPLVTQPVFIESESEK